MCQDCDAAGWADKINTILDEADLSSSTRDFLASLHEQAEHGHLTDSQIAKIEQIAEERGIDL